ncbi:MAG: hypothetical protein WCO29_07330, partial [Nostocales cyanobacterium ELA583]
TVHSLTKYETPLVNLSPHPSLTLPYKGGKRSSFYDWRGFELGSLYDKKVQLLAVLSIIKFTEITRENSLLKIKVYIR